MTEAPSTQEAELGGATDADGDGYTTTDDCDDADAAVHPRRAELANGVDDNCTGSIDEPMLVYEPVRPSETSAVPRFAPITLRVTDAATLAYLAQPAPPVGPLRIGYRLTFQALENGSGAQLVVPLTTVAVTGRTLPNTTRRLTIDLNTANPSLRRRTVYRVKVQLATAAGVLLGPSSDWSYLVTAGDTTAPSDALGWGSVDMALHAFDQLGDDLDGLIGKEGTVDPDGTRFADPSHPRYNPGDEFAWCDWFTHWVGATASDAADGALAANVVVDGGTPFWHDLNPNGMPGAFRDVDHDGCGTELSDLDGDGVNGEVINAECNTLATDAVAIDADDNRYYASRANRLYSDPTYSRASAQRLGNYVDIDHHAGLFLAFDPLGDGTRAGAGITGTVWTIEGNYGNQVAVVARAADSTAINGWGRLTLDLFEP